METSSHLEPEGGCQLLKPVRAQRLPPMMTSVEAEPGSADRERLLDSNTNRC